MDTYTYKTEQICSLELYELLLDQPRVMLCMQIDEQFYSLRPVWVSIDFTELLV